MSEKRGFRFSYELKQLASDEAEILIYSEIVSWKWRESDPEITATDFDKLLKEAKKNGATKLRLRINSPGGSVWQAVAMKTMLDMSSFEEIHVDIEGLCASAATFFTCVQNAHVRIAQGSEFMIHNPYTYGGGTSSDFLKTAERLAKMENEQHEMYAARTGQTEEQIKAWMDAETWFTAKEAVEYGFADEMMQATDAAACLDTDSMNLMREMYNCVPQEMGTAGNAAPDNQVRNTDAQVANAPVTEYQNTHKEGNNQMDIREITEQQLAAENPELYNAIRNAGITSERQRMQEIDALTDEGFEQLAQDAKNQGTSAADFLKQVVAARSQKKKDFLQQRAAETAPAQQVTGGASEDSNLTVEQEIAQYAKEMAELAKSSAISANGMY